MKLVAAGALLAACSGPGNDGDDGGVSITYVEVGLYPAAANRDLDLLFVIDDSPSMLDKQSNLKNNFPSFINVMNTLPGGLPNVHIGVVSTDLGTKGADDAQAGPGIGSGPGSCSGNGKAGNLQTNGSTVVSGNFISDTKNTDGTRTLNYNVPLAAAFDSLASLGAAGCGFEQPIEAVKRALNNNPMNAGFVRQSARLGIVVLADEDDCSLARSTLLGNDTTSLGPLQSFRCTRFGVTCDVGGKDANEMQQIGVKSACHSNEASQYLTDLDRYVSFLAGLKPDPHDIAVAVLAGPTTPLEVELRTPPGGGVAVPAIAHSCTYNGANGPEVADPGVRLQDFTERVRNGTFQTLCEQDLSRSLTKVALQMSELTGGGPTCLRQNIAMPADCKVFDESGATQTPLPDCASSPSARPCYSLVADDAGCPVTTQHLKLDVMRDGPPPASIWTSVRCKL